MEVNLICYQKIFGISNCMSLTDIVQTFILAFSCVPTDYFLDFMYATYAKSACKLIILAKHFCVLTFQHFFANCGPLPFFYRNNKFVRFMCREPFLNEQENYSFSSIFLDYTMTNFKITCQPHRSWEQHFHQQID